MENWIAITAGFSPQEIQKAARRVKRDASSLFSFSNHLVITPENLSNFAPTTHDKYKEYLNENSFGYGYFVWKAEIVMNVLLGEHGKCDGIVWIDAGCEVFVSPWTKLKFKNSLSKARESGYMFFELNTPEAQYSKNKVLRYFGSKFIYDLSPQIQATHFFLHGEQGRAIARKWFAASMQGIDFLDHTPSEFSEIEGFVLHKSDQSLLSLTAKSLNLMERTKVPPAGNRGFISRWSASRAPIWVSRNRTGTSIQSKIQRLFVNF